MTRPVEVELKYRLRDVLAGERYLTAESIGPFTPASPTRTTQLEDRYLDTADRALARAGFAARLRQSARRTVVSVKSIAGRPSASGPHRREELEGPADRTVGPLEWPASDARSLILELCGDAPLVELVTIRQLRRKRQLKAGATLVELSLDEVDVLARSAVVDRFVELEAELVKGDEAPLDELAAVLGEDPALGDAWGSKLEAALEAVRRHGRPVGPRPGPLDEDRAEPEAGEAATPEVVGDEGQPEPAAVEPPGPPVPDPPVPDPRGSDGAETPVLEGLAPIGRPAAPVRPALPALVVGKTPGVMADDLVAEAGRKVLRFHLARMLAYEPGTREGSDPEDLHKMRVATRRMRAAWRIFGEGFRPDRTKRYRKRLRRIAGRLGAVRDLDVLLEAGDAYRGGLPVAEQRALEPLLEAWRQYRDDARVLLLRELDSSGHAAFVEDFRVFVQTDGAGVLPVAPTQPHRIRDTAPAAVWNAYGQVRAYEAVLRWADVETLHELRIAAKWLRYSLEFIRDSLGPDVSPLVERVTALQDHLGLMHDADVSASMACQFLVERSGGLGEVESAAIGRYLVSREREVARLQRTVGSAWRGVAGPVFRRGLGRTLAGL